VQGVLGSNEDTEVKGMMYLEVFFLKMFHVEHSNTEDDASFY